jgi:hypothetical protein
VIAPLRRAHAVAATVLLVAGPAVVIGSLLIRQPLPRPISGQLSLPIPPFVPTGRTVRGTGPQGQTVVFEIGQTAGTPAVRITPVTSLALADPLLYWIEGRLGAGSPLPNGARYLARVRDEGPTVIALPPGATQRGSLAILSRPADTVMVAVPLDDAGDRE